MSQDRASLGINGQEFPTSLRETLSVAQMRGTNTPRGDRTDRRSQRQRLQAERKSLLSAVRALLYPIRFCGKVRFGNLTLIATVSTGLGHLPHRSLRTSDSPTPVRSNSAS